MMNVLLLPCNMGIEKMAVIGAGQMGNGITQVAACAGIEVVMIDIQQEYVDKGIATINGNSAKVTGFPKKNALPCFCSFSICL